MLCFWYYVIFSNITCKMIDWLMYRKVEHKLDLSEVLSHQIAQVRRVVSANAKQALQTQIVSPRQLSLLPHEADCTIPDIWKKRRRQN